MPGAGKSTVGRALAEISERQLVDIDAEIEKKYGPIPAIFDSHGEEYFRALETEEVRALGEGLIVSTGGGLVLREENVALLKERGKLIYLRTGLETLIGRVRGDTSRPLLRGDPAERLKLQLAARKETYERVADLTVDTDGRTPAEIARGILFWEMTL